MKQIQLICLFTGVLCASPSWGQWVQTNGPFGGSGQCFAVSGSNVFVGTVGGGAYLSADSGTAWAGVSNGLTNRYVMCLIASGTNLFAGTSGGGVFRSSDNGTSWLNASSGLADPNVLSLAASGTNLFAGTGAAGVFVSTNSGTSWVQTDYPTLRPAHCLVISGTNLFAGSDSGVFRSTNNGTSWTAVDLGLTSLDIRCIAVSGENLLAGAIDGNVFLSTNDGASWSARGPGLPGSSVLALAVSGGSCYAGVSNEGVFLSTNQGTSWTAINSGLTNKYIVSLAVLGTNLFAGTSDGGVFRSTNNGSVWTASNSGITNTSPEIHASGTGLFAMNSFEFGLTRSTDEGNNWVAVNAGLPVDNALTAFAADSAELFAATDSGVFASTTKGDTWNLLGLKDTLVTALAVRGGNVYAGGGRAHWSGVLLSTDNGHSWSEIYSPSKDSMSWFITGLAVNGQSVFASGIIGGFAGSRGGWLSVRIVRDGTHWMLADSGLPGLSTFLAICGSNLFAGETSLFRSTNGGANWNQVTGGLANTNVNALAVSGSNLFAATGSVNGSPGCVFLSTDNGTSWTSVNSGLTGIWVSSLAVSGPNIYAGTIGCGVWRRPLLEMVTSVQPGIREVPRQFLLNQNYPNPFNPSTTIRYDLPRSSMVRLNVYDILGREVSVLVNERKNAGSYEVKFDAVRLASGVYFYRIQAGDFIQAKKLVVIK